VRGNALNFVDSTDSTVRRSTSFDSVMTNQWLKDAPSGSPLRIITDFDSISSTNQCSTSAETDRQEAHGRFPSLKWILSPKRQYDEPVGVTCDGWCEADPIPHATVVSAICAWWKGRQTDTNDTFTSPPHWQLSLSACADPQRAWEGPRGSLTAVLCRFLGQRTLLEYDLLCATNLINIW
jgi:hypothetical protein